MQNTDKSSSFKSRKVISMECIVEKYIKNYMQSLSEHVEADAFITLQLDQCHDLTETMNTRQELGTAFERL